MINASATYQAIYEAGRKMLLDHAVEFAIKALEDR